MRISNYLVVKMTLRLIVFVLFLVPLVCCQNHSKPDYSTDLETELRNLLFDSSRYSVLQRPAMKVDVTVSLNLLTINDLSIKEQTMSLTGYFALVWSDNRLNWSNQTKDYSNIIFLFSTEKYVWRPALIIDNSVQDLSVISDENIPMRIIIDGMVTWNPAGIYVVACESDITYYPLDIQTCTISISSWSYTSSEIELHFESEPVSLNQYSENGEWELIKTSASETGSRSRGGKTFSNLKFSIKMRRRPTFHVLNTLFPVALMAVLSAMVFKLPPDSGEKIGFSLTVLLAYAVYLTLISDNIPSTSVHVCYLSVYLALILAYGTISVLCTILVLDLHYRTEEEEIPRWLHNLTTTVLMKIACWKDNCLCCKMKQRVKPCYDETKVSKMSMHKAPLPNGNNTVTEEDAEENAWSDGSIKSEQLSWQTIASVFDKFFFVVFMVAILITSVFLFVTLLSEYLSA